MIPGAWEGSCGRRDHIAQIGLLELSEVTCDERSSLRIALSGVDMEPV